LPERLLRTEGGQKEARFLGIASVRRVFATRSDPQKRTETGPFLPLNRYNSIVDFARAGGSMTVNSETWFLTSKHDTKHDN
jgi:hypothetical protein